MSVVDGMSAEFYSLEILCMDWTQREREAPEGGLVIIREAEQEYYALVRTLFALEDEENQ